MNPNRRKLSIILGALLGTAAVQVALYACSQALETGDGVPDAHAAPSDCQAWEYKTLYTAGGGVGNAAEWEPFSSLVACNVAQVACGGNVANTSAFVMVRRCAP